MKEKIPNARNKVVFFVFSLLGIFFLGKILIPFLIKSFENSLTETINHPTIKIVKISGVNCSLPEDDKGVDKLLDRLRVNKNWKVGFSSREDWRLDYLFAAKTFGLSNADDVSFNGFVWGQMDDRLIWKKIGNEVNGFRVAVIDPAKFIDVSNKKMVNADIPSDYLLTRVSCQHAGDIILKTYPDFKFGIRSNLLVENKKCGLLIEEWGGDPLRRFTEKFLNSTMEELK